MCVCCFEQISTCSRLLRTAASVGSQSEVSFNFVTLRSCSVGVFVCGAVLLALLDEVAGTQPAVNITQTAQIESKIEIDFYVCKYIT